MNLNKELHEALGYCWHEQYDTELLECSKCGASLLFPCNRNHDYIADPRLVIREMMKRNDYGRFILYVWDKDIPPETDGALMHIDTCLEIIELVSIDTTGKLARAALDWLNGQKEGES